MLPRDRAASGAAVRLCSPDRRHQGGGRTYDAARRTWRRGHTDRARVTRAGARGHPRLVTVRHVRERAGTPLAENHVVRVDGAALTAVARIVSCRRADARGAKGYLVGIEFMTLEFARPAARSSTCGRNDTAPAATEGRRPDTNRRPFSARGVRARASSPVFR